MRPTFINDGFALLLPSREKVGRVSGSDEGAACRDLYGDRPAASSNPLNRLALRATFSPEGRRVSHGH